MAALTVIASSQQNGPLVADLGRLELATLLLRDPGALAAYVNADLMAAMEDLPEGARVELAVTGWTDLITRHSWAEFIAGQVQQAWERGEFIDPDTGQRPQAWAEHPNQIAWGDNASDTIWLRAVKNAVPVFALWIVIGLLGVLAAYLLWGWMRSADWIATYAEPKPGAPPPPPGPFQPGSGEGFFDNLKRNALWIFAGAGALAATPFVIDQIREIQRSSRGLKKGGRG